MPPPYSSSSNFSYANFNKPSGTSEPERAGNEDEASDAENEEDDDREDDENELSRIEECVPFINNLCLDVQVYPK